MRGRIRFALIAAAGMIGLCGCSIGGKKIVFKTEEVDDSYVFSVNESKCSVEEAKVYLCNYKNLYGTMYAMDLWSYDFGDASIEEYVKSVTINELARIYCMEQIAKQQEISLSEEEQEKVRTAAENYEKSLSKEELAFLKISRKDIEKYYTRYALAKKLYRAMTDGMDTEVSDDDARVIRIQQIFLTDDKKADTVADKLAAKEDFSAVASKYNQAKEAELLVGRGNLPDAVEAAAFNLNDNEVSERIDTVEGTYFIKCINKYEKELTESNKEVIRQEREKNRFDKAYGAFLEAAKYDINEDAWKAVTFGEEADKIKTDSFFMTYDQIFEKEE